MKHDEQARFVLQHTGDAEFAVVEEGKVVEAGIGAVDEGSDEIDNRIGEPAKRVFRHQRFLGNISLPQLSLDNMAPMKLHFIIPAIFTG
jgi:hypothetical protein